MGVVLLQAGGAAAQGQSKEPITLRVGAGLAIAGSPERGSGIAVAPGIEVPLSEWMALSAGATWAFITREEGKVRVGAATDSMTAEGDLRVFNATTTISTAGLELRLGKGGGVGRIGLKGIVGMGGYSVSAPEVDLDAPFHVTDEVARSEEGPGIYWEVGGSASLHLSPATALYLDARLRRSLGGGNRLSLVTMEIGGSVGL